MVLFYGGYLCEASDQYSWDTELPTSFQSQTIVNAEADNESPGKHWVHMPSDNKAVRFCRVKTQVSPGPSPNTPQYMLFISFPNQTFWSTSFALTSLNYFSPAGFCPDSVFISQGLCHCIGPFFFQPNVVFNLLLSSHHS